MKLISTPVALKSELLRLIKKYPNISFGTAWASASTDVFTNLIQVKKNIRCAVIGTHFYQTDPDVLDEFVGSHSVKFVLQTQGVFHPKVFAFWDDNASSWEILIGSANLTAGAITKNTELSTLISNTDGFPTLLNETLNIIKGYTADARTVSQIEADNYRRIWAQKVRSREKLEGRFGRSAPTKPEVDSTVMSLDWRTFYELIQGDKAHGFDERLAMLNAVAKAFASAPSFNDLSLEERLGIAGLRSKVIKNSEWFGSMVGAGRFYQLINRSEPAFSIALDAIPTHGTVTKSEYDRFISQYLKAFPNGGDGLSTATRLLSMKRPDTFLCVDSANRRKLAKDFGMSRPDRLDYQRYWAEVIERFQESPWWNSLEPKDQKEATAWKARAAMLDALFYEK